MSLNYYQQLNISQDSSYDQIKKAYKKLALKYHPDKNPSSDQQDKFKSISEAYQVLSDPQKREKYDRFLRTGIDFDQPNFVDPSDIFKSFFQERSSTIRNPFSIFEHPFFDDKPNDFFSSNSFFNQNNSSSFANNMKNFTSSFSSSYSSSSHSINGQTHETITSINNGIKEVIEKKNGQVVSHLRYDPSGKLIK